MLGKTSAILVAPQMRPALAIVVALRVSTFNRLNQPLAPNTCGKAMLDRISIGYTLTPNMEVISGQHAPQHNVRASILNLPMASIASGSRLNNRISARHGVTVNMEIITRA